MKYIILLIFLISAATDFGQDKLAYQLFSSGGKKITYSKMLRQLEKQELLFFGEYHNNPISHWLSLELIKDLQKNQKIQIGLEMFETDNQEELNKYLEGSIDARELDSTTRLWRNYNTDYKPIVDYAKKQVIPVIATNVPRRYASIVNRYDWEGLDTLAKKAYDYMAPLPIAFDSNLTCYKDMLTMMLGHGTMKMVKAQALKDATMAHSILKNLNKKTLFVHINGSYHSNIQQGIVWYIREAKPSTKLLTIATVSQIELSYLAEEHLEIADFILVVDADMTKTY